MSEHSPTKMENFLNHHILNIIISILIIISIFFLLVFRIGEYTVKTQKIFEFIDEIFLIIFSLEFIFKIIFLRKKYFFHGLGWIDFLAAIPVLIPVIKYLILQSNSNAFLENEAVNIAIMFRGLKFIRFLRVLRTARLFKIFTSLSKEMPHTPKFSITIPVIFSILLLGGGYGFATYTERKLVDDRQIEMANFKNIITENNIQNVLETKKNILILNHGFNFERTMSDADIIENFRTYEYKRIKEPGLYILYSIKDILRVSKNIETFSILIILFFIISVFIQFNIDVQKLHSSIND